MKFRNYVLPPWFSLGLLAAVVVGGFVAYGWIKSYVVGPDLAIATLYRPKPVPVKVSEVKWLTKIKKERVEVPVEVIREVPAKEEGHLEQNFGIKLADLKADNKELVDVLTVPKAPHGGEMALTANTASGKIEGIFRPNAAPFIEVGGMKEVGADFNVIDRGITGYYRQDLVRVGPVVINGKAFVTMPTIPGKTPSYGALIGGAVRF